MYVYHRDRTTLEQFNNYVFRLNLLLNNSVKAAVYLPLNCIAIATAFLHLSDNILYVIRNPFCFSCSVEVQNHKAIFAVPLPQCNQLNNCP